MLQPGFYIGIIIIIFALLLAYFYTNIFDVTKPKLEETVNSAKETITNLDGKDVISGIENITGKIINQTSKIEIKKPTP